MPCKPHTFQSRAGCSSYKSMFGNSNTVVVVQQAQQKPTNHPKKQPAEPKRCGLKLWWKGIACATLCHGTDSVQFLAVVGRLAVGRDVQTFALFFFGDTQTDGQVNDLEGDHRDHARPDNGQQHGFGLDPNL